MRKVVLFLIFHKVWKNTVYSIFNVRSPKVRNGKNKNNKTKKIQQESGKLHSDWDGQRSEEKWSVERYERRKEGQKKDRFEDRSSEERKERIKDG